MSNKETSDLLVQSRLARWKMQFNRMSIEEKLSKLLNIIASVFIVVFLVFVGLNIVDFLSYDTVYGTVINSEKTFDGGKLVGYTNTYIVTIGTETKPIISDSMVNKEYETGTHVKLYLKEKDSVLHASEGYRSEPVILTFTIISAVLIAGSSIASVVLNNKHKQFLEKASKNNKPISQDAVVDSVSDTSNESDMVDTESTETEAIEPTQDNTTDSQNIDKK